MGRALAGCGLLGLTHSIAIRELPPLRRPVLTALTSGVAVAVMAVAACGGDEPVGATAQGAASTPRPTAEATAVGSDSQGSYLSDAPTPAPADAKTSFAHNLVTILPKDRIPSIDFPFFLSADEGGKIMADGELVIGVSIDGDHRACSVPHLSGHEIVNDVVGGRKIAITRCPLCYSVIVFDREVGSLELTFGVSGMLLTMPPAPFGLLPTTSAGSRDARRVAASAAPRMLRVTLGRQAPAGPAPVAA